MAEKSKRLLNTEIFIDTSELELANNLWVNQIKTDRSFHFDTSAKIFGLGFGPKYLIGEEAIGQFAEKNIFLIKTFHHR